MRVCLVTRVQCSCKIYSFSESRKLGAGIEGGTCTFSLTSIVYYSLIAVPSLLILQHIPSWCLCQDVYVCVDACFLNSGHSKNNSHTTPQRTERTEQQRNLGLNSRGEWNYGRGELQQILVLYKHCAFRDFHGNQCRSATDSITGSGRNVYVRCYFA